MGATAYQLNATETGAVINPSTGAETGDFEQLDKGQIVSVAATQDVLSQMAAGGNVAVHTTAGRVVSVPAAALDIADSSPSASSIAPEHLPYVIAGAVLLVGFLYWNAYRE